jgi:hypothetical protein
MLWILIWILIIVVVVLCVIGLWLGTALLFLPFALLWHHYTPKMVNIVGRHTANNFTRGLAEGWVIASLPVPYILLIAIPVPSIGMMLIGADIVVWLFLALAEVIRNRGYAPEPWRDL